MNTYSPERKAALIARMMPPHNQSVVQLARSEGITDNPGIPVTGPQTAMVMAVVFFDYHALFAGGLTEGRLTGAAVEKASGKLQFTPAGIGDINATLTDINDIATATGFTGTPGIIIMPVSGATTENTTVFAGMTEVEPLQKAIDKARHP
ncbi:Uncharacterised protein [Serratia ficaria]|uniref:hypothetical protein n=1 Tax=Serratia ficaria TaxID=61651 RepID=UPI00218360F8|nr:hypothetical protein [Serratia ficaria]CAI1241024.1 Uncharacterised protein [Serratia ficaria]CAI2539943.1 Uncharacterised protein [Serratia ficaria]